MIVFDNNMNKACRKGGAGVEGYRHIHTRSGVSAVRIYHVHHEVRAVLSSLVNL